jgi:hypothetical protein
MELTLAEVDRLAMTFLFWGKPNSEMGMVKQASKKLEEDQCSK